MTEHTIADLYQVIDSLRWRVEFDEGEDDSDDSEDEFLYFQGGEVRFRLFTVPITSPLSALIENEDDFEFGPKLIFRYGEQSCEFYPNYIFASGLTLLRGHQLVEIYAAENNEDDNWNRDTMHVIAFRRFCDDLMQYVDTPSLVAQWRDEVIHRSTPTPDERQRWAQRYRENGHP